MARSQHTFALLSGALALFTATSSPAPAQTWEITDEINYAKNLARFRLFDLSSEHLNRMSKTGLEDDDKLAILYANAMLFKIFGEHADGLDARMDYLKKATEGYETFLDRADEQHDQFDLAQGEAAEVQRSMGSLLAEHIEIGDAPEGARAQAEAAFRKAIERLNKEFNRKLRKFERLEFDSMEASSQAEAQIEAYRPLMLLAATYYEFALLFDEGEFNREDYLTKAYEASEEFLWEVPSDSFVAFQVYYYAGLAYIGLNDLDEGMSRLEFVVDNNSGLPAWVESDPDMPETWVSQITREVEKCYLAIARAYNDQGKYDQTETMVARLDAYFERYAGRGVTRSQDGYAAQIELGRAHHLQGKPTGMRMLQDLANAHAKDRTGAMAAAAIGDILGDTGGDRVTVIPSTVWFTAGEAARAAGKFYDALDNYHKTLAALNTITEPTEKMRLELDSWSEIGKLYRGENRLVEAATAFRAGLDAAPAGDEGLDDRKSLGSALFNTLTMRYRETKDREDEKQKNNTMDMLQKLGVEQMAFLLAKDDFEAARAVPVEDEKKRGDLFKEAIKSLRRVKRGDDNYERSLIYIARCEAEQANHDKAISGINSFFKIVNDPKNSIGGTRRQMIQGREIARCEGTYYKALSQSQLDKHDATLVTLTGFEESFPTQEKFFKQVNYQRLRSYLALEPPKISEAEQLFDEKYAAGQLQVEAQYFLARSLLSKAAELDTAEQETSPVSDSPADGDADGAKALRGRGASHMYKFCESSGFNSYANLKLAGDAFSKIADWPQAEMVYIRLSETFGRDPKYRDRVNQVVKRSLAKALLAQDKFQQAADLFRDLLAQAQNKDRGIMQEAASAFGGRVDIGTNGRPVEVPGSGDYKEAVELWDAICDRGFDETTKFTPPWWEAKFYTIYARYRAKDISPEWNTQAKRLLKNLQSNVLAFYAKEEWAEQMGGEDWVKRYEYLIKQLK